MIAKQIAPILMTVDEMAETLRIGRTKAYALCREPGFPSLRIKGQIRVPRLRLERWLEAQTTPFDFDGLSDADAGDDAAA